MRVFALALIFGLGMTQYQRALGKSIVSLEWEKVSEALSYDVQVIDEMTGKIVQELSELKDSQPELQLPVGRYQVKVRSRDFRNIPGEWSSSRSVTVHDVPLVITSPQMRSILPAIGQLGLVQIDWETKTHEQVQAQVVIESLGKSNWRKEFKTTFPPIQVEVPVGFEYEVSVSSEATETTGPIRHQFQVLGPTLEAPKLNLVSSTLDNSQVSLEVDKEAKTTWVKIQKIEPEKGTIQTLSENQYQQGDVIRIERQATETYLLTAQSESPTRTPSSVSTQVLSPRLDNLALAKDFDPNEVYKRFADRTLSGSYILSNVNYNSISLEKSTRTSSQGVTGTAAFGFSMFDKSGSKGWYATGEFGGLQLQGKNLTFLAGSIGRLHRWSLSPKSDLRVHYGFRFSEVPEFIFPESGSIVTGKAKVLAPYVQLEAWHHLSGVWGAQFFLNLSQGALGQSYSGENLSFYSRQGLGLQIARRFKLDFVGFAGFSRFNENLKYSGESPVGGIKGSNEVTLQGDYLFLAFEWWVP